MKDYKYIFFSPPAFPDPSLAIAASKSGALGILDLQFISDCSNALFCLKKLDRFARSSYGVSLTGNPSDLHWKILETLPQQLTTIVLPGNADDEAEELIKALHAKGRMIIIEAVTIEEARRAVSLGADGLIAKGNESGGRVGPDTAFILFQRIKKSLSLPIWVRGGIGIFTAPACFAAGARGVCLDSQLYLTPESGLPETIKVRIRQMDGTESTILGESLKETYRVYRRLDTSLPERIRKEEEKILETEALLKDKQRQWRELIASYVGWSSPEENLFFLGQDASFAKSLVDRYGNAGSILQGILEQGNRSFSAAMTCRPLDHHSPLATVHGTTYPIVQGPMNRVSDRPLFAKAVADEGALPFIAIGLLPGNVVEKMLQEAREILNGRPWGVGLLGFTPPSLQEEQFEGVCRHQPPFALIAGGRHDQYLRLETCGISTYLHVPSPVILRLYLQKGVKKFIFEGSECGGHIGPRSSFILWNAAIEVFEDFFREHPHEAKTCQVLFAGGIHDAASSAMAAVIGAPIAEKGVKIGVQIGTAYLFTNEAVSNSAILTNFQEEVIRCHQTVVLETGPGHAVRCSPTPFCKTFQDQKRTLMKQGKSREEVQRILEDLNLGRLGIATRGISIFRSPSESNESSGIVFQELSPEEQKKQGLYMLGQVACLRDQTLTIRELHENVSLEGTRIVASLSAENASPGVDISRSTPSDIAIVGMACLLPGAHDLKTYWENILRKVCAIREVPGDRWNWRLWYDPDPKAQDKTCSKWGGFLDEVLFDPVEFGMPPNSIPSIEPLHLLTLLTVKDALEDAGYDKKPFPRDRTSVILGAGGGIADLGHAYAFRSFLPFMEASPRGIISANQIVSHLGEFLPEWTEDSFAGILMNVAAGRVANRLDLGGVNYTVDAACASSLAALNLAVTELETGSSDMVIVGGVDTMQGPFSFLAFSKSMALSPQGACRCLDERADGIVISEGLGIIILKRLEDAERDGDRIYAIIKGIAGSSDGKAKGLTAPSAEGQLKALRRAYEKAGISPATIELVEAHATGTSAGDREELKALNHLFLEAHTPPKHCSIGSIKSMIGHTKGAAAIASTIKVALSLHHKILPPTLGVERPLSEIASEHSPFYVNTEPRPWINVTAASPRRASVSAMGFGGSNFHAVLEEYSPPEGKRPLPLPTDNLSHEIFLWNEANRADLAESLSLLERSLAQGGRPCLKDLSFSLLERARVHSHGPTGCERLAIVAESCQDLQNKLAIAKQMLHNQGFQESLDTNNGIYYTKSPLLPEGKIVFLFSGQGAQYKNMLEDLGLLFSEVRESIERADQVLADKLPHPLSSYIYPPPAWSNGEGKGQQTSLTQTQIAQPAIAAMSMGIYRLLSSFEIHPAMLAGHSLGEITALCPAGCFSEENLYLLAEARGRMVQEAQGSEPGSMAAILSGPDVVEEILKDYPGCWITNINSPTQTVVSGTTPVVKAVIEEMGSKGIPARLLPVSCAFHSPLVAPAGNRLIRYLEMLDIQGPRKPVFSNTTTDAYPSDPKHIPAMLGWHLIQPVRWVEEIEAIYSAGGRIFVEVGPSTILTGLVKQILNGRTFLALCTDQNGKSALPQLLSLIAQLYSHGYPVKLDRLFHGREPKTVDPISFEASDRPMALPDTAWLLTGSRARPAYQAKKAASPADKVSPAIEPPQQQEIHSQRPATSPYPSLSGSANTGPLPEGSSEVMRNFQRLMDRFLETQKAVMLSYLHGDRIQAGVSPSHVEHAEQKDRLEAPGVLKEEVQPSAREIVPCYHHESIARDPNKADERGSLPHHLDPEDLERILLERFLAIVSERTGYPRGAIGEEVDLEAELGIDSIKRLEILAGLRTWMLSTGLGDLEEKMEGLSRQKTAKGIIAQLSVTSSATKPVTVPTITLPVEKTTYSESESTDRERVQRFVFHAQTLPPNGIPLSLPVPGTILLTEDTHGVSDILCGLLRASGQKLVSIRPATKTQRVKKDLYTIRASCYEDMTLVLKEIRDQWGPIGGIVHCTPLSPSGTLGEMNRSTWRERIQEEVKSLFYLIRIAGRDLLNVRGGRAGCIIAATAMGGNFAFTNGFPSTEYFPGQAGIQGLLKTLAQELPSLCTRIIDFPASLPSREIAEQIYSEIGTEKGPIEVGFDGSQRVVFTPVLTPLDFSSKSPWQLDTNSKILVTGGARGITYDVVHELAVHYQPHFILIGSTPTPPPQEAPHTNGLTSMAEIKAALIAHCRGGGTEPRLSDIEKLYQRLLKEREIRKNLKAIESTGARVEYCSIDVQDQEAFGQFIDDCYARLGNIDGVIHGAGIIEDKKILDKSPESFEKVFDTKVESAFTIARKLRSNSLRFLVFFSSVAGSFGNSGQSDYAAANEVLNKLATYLDSRWPARVVSINWGPWDTGMVTPELKRQFAKRGISLIPPDIGKQRLTEELLYGSKGEAEIIIGDVEGWGHPCL